MLGVRDMADTIAWYESIGFELVGSHGEAGALDWASLRLGQAEVMIVPASGPWGSATSSLGLWIRAERLDDLYGLLRERQLERAAAELAGRAPEGPEVQFAGDLYTAFYGQREFALRDPGGIVLTFYQPLPS